MKEYILVMVTAPSAQEGENIAKALVEEGLAACCSIISGVRSIYMWKGDICDEKEAMLFIKTKSTYFVELSKRIEKLHSYEVPEIISFRIEDGFEKYMRWIDDSLER